MNKQPMPLGAISVLAFCISMFTHPACMAQTTQDNSDATTSTASSSSSGSGLSAIVQTFLTNSSRETSALATTMKQGAIKIHQIADSTATAGEAVANAIQAIHTQAKIAKTVIDYSPDTGIVDGMDCGSISEADATKKVGTFANKYAQHMGQKWASKTAQEGDSLSILEGNLFVHKNNFCTSSEARNDSCKIKFNGMQGYDLTYGTIARNYTMHEDLELAGIAFVSNLVGPSVTPTKRLLCKSVACQTGQLAQLRSIAINTAAQDTLMAQISLRRAMNWNNHQHKLDETLPSLVGEEESKK
ncbi:MAG: hypothetical protein IKZ87_04265 [Actinomycetaceae bacterium]|nr:hypothetical protein [Actinomycetaceae bacterium]